MLLNSRYQKVGTVGTGSYGTVYKAIDKKPKGKDRTIDPKYMEMFKKFEKDIEMIDEMPVADREAITSMFGAPQNFLLENSEFESSENDKNTSNVSVEEEEEKTASDIESSPAKPEPFIIPDKPEKPVDAAQTILTPESEPENSEKSPAP